MFKMFTRATREVNILNGGEPGRDAVL